MRILITGSTGFLGGSVGRFAAAAGHDVTGVARRSQPDPTWPGRHVAADVATADLAAAVRDAAPDLVFHAAGTASVAGSFAAPLDDLRAAALTWANLLDAVRRSGLRPRVVFPSSAAVYGNPAALPVAEEAPADPISPYGYHKLACELVAREYNACFGTDAVVCRIFSVVGPAQRRLLAWEIYRQLRGAAPIVRLRGTGQESRDYLHVDDLAAAVLTLESADGLTTYNLGSGTETRVADLAAELARAAGTSKPVVWSGHAPSGDPTRWVADVTRTRQALPGWVPRPLSASVLDCVRRWDDQARLPA